MSTTYRTTTTTTTLAEAESVAYAQADAFFGDREYRFVSSHGQQGLVRMTSACGPEDVVPTVVEVDWEFREATA